MISLRVKLTFIIQGNRPWVTNNIKIKDEPRVELIWTSCKLWLTQLIIEKFPISIFKIIERINIEFLKKNFNDQSQIKVKDYKIDINSRQIFLENKQLKLTEKEVNTIIYLLNAQNPVSPMELQKKVWGYQSDLETHTVETHIYRLRKKFLDLFGDDKFIISVKNGYKI